MATDIETIVEKLARLDERVGVLIRQIDHLTSSTGSRETVSELERRIISLEGDRAKIGWIVMASVLAALLALVVGAAPLIAR